MKRFFIIVCLNIFSGVVLAQQRKLPEKKGGIVPCLATCLIGSRVGLEMNEGKDIYQNAWIALS